MQSGEEYTVFPLIQLVQTISYHRLSQKWLDKKITTLVIPVAGMHLRLTAKDTPTAMESRGKTQSSQRPYLQPPPSLSLDSDQLRMSMFTLLF
jgi:hypothetical protein